MTTFLWMLYLAFTIFITVKSLYWIILTIRTTKEVETALFQISCVLPSILWSIWYFYYLN